MEGFVQNFFISDNCESKTSKAVGSGEAVTRLTKDVSGLASFSLHCRISAKYGSLEQILSDPAEVCFFFCCFLMLYI